MAKLLNHDMGMSRRDLLTATATAVGVLSLPTSILHASTQSKAPITGGVMDLDRFIEDCVQANREDDSQSAVQEVLIRAVSSPNKVIAALGEPKDGVEAYGAAALFEKDTAALPSEAVHSVTNPLLRFTGGIHIYGGDFFDTERSQWDPETLEEEPSDGAAIREIFKKENKRLGISENG
jgi:hypothetical protein